MAIENPPARTLGSRAWSAYTHARRTWWRATDRRRLDEARGRIVFEHLRAHGPPRPLPPAARILEIGPKHGEDSRLLAALAPSELVLLDLPEKLEQVQRWLPAVEAICPTRYVTGNLLYLRRGELEELGTFDLVWCLGVVYHNVEQLRLLRRLFHLTAPETGSS